MRERILGIDTGTNSIGWAIVDYDNEALEYKYTLIDKGVNIFQEGVKIEKGIESSKAADRSEHKHQRVGYWRRKIRKIKLLRLLIDNKLCPPLSAESLKNGVWKRNIHKMRISWHGNAQMITKIKILIIIVTFVLLRSWICRILPTDIR